MNTPSTQLTPRQRTLLSLGAAIVGLALLFVFEGMFDVFTMQIFKLCAINVILALSLNLINGFTGLFSLGHAGFMAVGAYTVGILTVDHGWSFWAAFPMAGVVSAFIGYFVGIVSLRLKGHFFSIFTLCVGYIMFLVIEKWEGLTHGTVGIMGIPEPEAIGALTFDTPLRLYYFVLFFLVVLVWVMRRIVKSLLGRTFIAIRNSDELAEALPAVFVDQGDEVGDAAQDLDVLEHGTAYLMHKYGPR